MNTHETAYLISHCLDGDDVAVETLVRTYHPLVSRLALSMLNDAAEADEAAQDALIKMLDALRSYRGECSFKTWLYTITLNVCRGRLRKRYAREKMQQALQAIFRWTHSSPEHPEAIVMEREGDAKVRCSVNSLNEALRLPIVLRYEHDLPIAEIAHMLGVTERTIHNRLRTAHDQLRVALDGQLERQ